MVATGYMRLAVRIAVLTLTTGFPLEDECAGLLPQLSFNADEMPQKNAFEGEDEAPKSNDGRFI